MNGLPSIELKYHYPQVAEDEELMGKLRSQEDVCLAAADIVLTVSDVNRDYLIERRVDANKIRVIRNGVDLDVFTLPPRERSKDDVLRLLYTGTMSAWQGVDLAIDALALYLRDAPATLKIVGPIRRRERKRLERHIWKSGVGDCVTLHDAVSKAELVQVYHESDVALAPLTRHDRNLHQGCCPLKVIEAMATGTPLVASRIPVVEELAENDREALLVRAGSAKAIKDAFVRLRSDPTLANKLRTNARQRAEREFSWKSAQSKLSDVYSELLSGS